MSGEDDRETILPKSYLSFREDGKMVEEEKNYIKEHRPGHGKDNDYFVGLAISGGGIRSASFSIGVMQALARAGWMKAMDYLSTVSGGGYSGSSLTWFLHSQPAARAQKAAAREKDTLLEPIQSDGFGVSEENFPFGTGVDHEDDSTTRSRKRRQMGVMRHLLQNINYLFPGHGLNVFAFLAVLGRGILLNLLTYIPLGLGLMLSLTLVLGACYGQAPDAANLAQLSKWGLGLLLLTAAGGVLYGWWSTVGHRCESWMYAFRRYFAILGGFLLLFALFFFLLASLPWVDARLDTWREEVASSLTLGGVLGAIWASLTSGKGDKAKIPSGVIVPVASALLLYGLALLLYIGAKEIFKHEGYGLDPVWWIPALLAISLAFGMLVNINYISLHRYYRDRLMELFMPGRGSLRECKAGQPQCEANRTYIQDVCDYENGFDGPYHIINGNVVLVGSEVTKFRGRGGDNFIFSPLYCGSSATGWASSREFLGGRMTLPTAMAISGAAVNPNTGSSGQGPTRNPMLSVLMGLLNLRLGFWAQNPQGVLCGKKENGKATIPPQHDSRTMRILWRMQCLLKRPIPNLLIPGMRDLLRFRFRETSYVVQLTDGGHFENLALYELIRRKVDCIVLVDGAADPRFGFADFAHLVEIARLDFAATIDIDLSPLVPQKKNAAHGIDKLAEQGFTVGTIRYKGDEEKEAKTGILIYIKTTLTDGLPEDIYGYKIQNPDFPDQSTGDQFFDEQQFEAYRELGFQLGRRMTASMEAPDNSAMSEQPDLLEKLRRRLETVCGERA